MQFYTKKTSGVTINYSCSVTPAMHKKVCSIIKDGEEWFAYEKSDVFAAARERVSSDLWAFTPQFLSRMTGLSIGVFLALGQLCEDSREAVQALVAHTCGIDEFVHEALDVDGYGHFLSTYDGLEVVVTVGKKMFYLYRSN